MAGRDIRTTIALDGEKEFKRAISDAKREMTVLGSELKAARADFDNTGDAQAFATKKSKVLGQQLSQQRAIVKALEGAVGDMAKKHGEASKEVQEMTIQLNDARAKTSRLEREFRDAEKEAKDLGRGLDKNVEKEAKASAKAVDGLSDKLEGLQSDVGKIKGMGGIELGMDILGNAKDWAQQFMEWGREGRDYLRQEVMTQYRAERAGLSQEFVDEQINRAGALIGDREEARSGIGTLLNIEGLDENSLKTYVDNLLGLYLLNPWASFSGLAEGLQQTASNRDLDGQYKEALERLGYTAKELENINDQLKKGIDQTDAAGIALTPLAGKGVMDTLARYENENQQLIQGEATEQKIERAKSELKAAAANNEWIQGLESTWLDMLDTFSVMLGGKAVGPLGEFMDYWENNPPQNAHEAWMMRSGLTRSAWEEMDRASWANSIEPTGVTAAMQGQKFLASRDAEIKRQEALQGLMKNAYIDVGTKVMYGMGETYEQIQQALFEKEETMEDVGEALMNAIKQGISSRGEEAVTAARGIASSITAELSRIAVPNIPSMVASAGGYSIGGALTNVAVNLDGRRVGQLVTPYVSKNQGRTV